MTHKIEIYTIMSGEVELAQKETFSNTFGKNRTEYCFEGNSIKLVNLAAKEDLLIKKKTPNSVKTYKQDLRKAMVLLNKMY